MTLGLAVVFAASSAGAFTVESQWKELPQGQLILRPFEAAPYPHPSRDKGYQGRNQFYPKDPHYRDSTVGIFIPAGYVAGDSVDYVVHFHGHNNHVEKAIKQYKLLESFEASKVNAILIVPQGPRDAADSGGGKLELDKNGFERLIKEVTAFLNEEKKIHTSKVGEIVLTTHSGGYKVTAAILDHGGMARQITDVLLLDSSYGNLEWFANWAKASPEHRLVSLFTQHLAAANKELMGILDKDGVKYQQLNEETETDEELAERGVTFVPIKGPHDEVPVQYMTRLLRESPLPKR